MAYCKDIILLGRTGNGKSSLGNSLLGRNAFKVDDTLNSETKECKKLASINICVTDTPGLCDTEHHVADIALKILSCLNECPNPHAFLIVFSALGRMSHDELRTISLLRIIFTQKCLECAIVVFTGYDESKSNKEFENYWSTNTKMREFVQECSGRVARIDNKASEDSKRQRVRTIIELVERVSGQDQSRFDSSFKNLHETVLKTQLSKQSKKTPTTESIDKEVQQITHALAYEYKPVLQKLADNLKEYENVGKILFGFGCVACGIITVNGQVPEIHLDTNRMFSVLITALLHVNSKKPITEILQELQECLRLKVTTPEKAKRLVRSMNSTIMAILSNPK